MFMVVWWIEGGIVLSVVWVVMMIVGKVIRESIMLAVSGVLCGSLKRVMNIDSFRMLNMMDGMVVRLLMFILIMLVMGFLGVNFFR